MIVVRRALSLVGAVFFSTRQRSTVTAVLLTGIAGVSTVWLLRPLVRELDAATIDETAGFYFEIAVNLAWCGRYPYVTSSVPENRANLNLSRIAVATAGARTVRSLVDHGAGSLAQYCRLQGGVYAIHEPSIAIVESALLAGWRRITVAEVALVLKSVAMAGLFMFAFALAKLRWPILFVAAATATAMYLTVLLGGNALYSQYPLVLPTTLAGISVAALCLAYGVYRRPAWFAAAAFILGIWAGFLGNLRTSHFPTALLIAGLFVAFGTVEAHRVAPTSRRTLAAVAGGALAALVAGVLAFDRVWIAPIRAVPQAGNYSYHVIAHPLVLGLATPPSALAAREQIEWNDAIGLVQARKIDPQVVFLGPGYESALFTYYRRLWAAHPAEMFAIYRQKMGVTRRHAEAFLASDAKDLFWTSKDNRWLPVAAWPATRIAAGVGVIGLFAAVFLAGCLRPSFLDLDGPRGFCLAALAVAGVLGFLESAVVLSGVILWYSSVYLYALIFIGLLVYQALLDGCAQLALRIVHR